jgi:hypothetical protein
MKRGILLVLSLLMGLVLTAPAFSAYNHPGEKDSPNFLAVYPDQGGTKLDRCALCHTGGESVNKQGQPVPIGSCQWCHSSYGYDGSGNIVDTLNAYGKDYLVAGRNQEAIQSIANLDSDGDGYANGVEIAATRYPGSAEDDPTKVTAPFKVYTKAQLEAMPQHTQFLLMNTSRSGDYYAEYSGVVMEDLLADAGISSTATGIIVYSPDGFSTTHPLEPDPNPNYYHVNGVYPESSYYYNAVADQALNADGWCDYSAPSCQGRSDGDAIVVPDGLRMILAVTREGVDMDPGVLDASNRLDGEGPFRVVPPQKVPGPPDQLSTASNPALIWPYDPTADHNAGFSTRTATIIKVEPLPPGTTDIDLLEAGWNFVDQEKIIIYGDIAGSSVATVDGQLSITIDPFKLAGGSYRVVLAPSVNPADPSGLYWTLSSYEVSTADATEGFATADDALNILIPRLQYGGSQFQLRLDYAQDAANPTTLYWKLGPASPIL